MDTGAGAVSREWIDVLAYAGDPVARGTLDFADEWAVEDGFSADHRALALLSLLAELPPVRREVECVGCWSPSGSYRLPGVDCSLCNGTGLHVLETPAVRWWAVQVGLWCAEAVLRRIVARHAPVAPHEIAYPRRALDAVQRWLDEPTQERAGEWGNALGFVGAGEFLWLPRAWTMDHRTQILAASELIDVRAVVLAGLQGVT